MLKRLLSSVLVLFFLTALTTPLTIKAEESITVYVDGAQVSFQVAPINDSGTTLVPFRSIFERLGFSIAYTDGEGVKTVIGSRISDGLQIFLNIDDHIATVRNKKVSLDIAPKIINGSTFIPLRFVAEASGGEVKWNGESKRVDIVTDISYYLTQAVIKKDLGKMKEYLSKGANPNYVDKMMNNTPLEWAIHNDSPEQVQLLINYGADAKQLVRTSGNLLHKAVFMKNIDILKMLVKAGADVKAKDSLGRTPLDDAKYYNLTEIIAYLTSVNEPKNTSEIKTPVTSIIPKEERNVLRSPLLSPDKLPYTLNFNSTTSLTVNSVETKETGFYLNVTFENHSKDKIDFSPHRIDLHYGSTIIPAKSEGDFYFQGGHFFGDGKSNGTIAFKSNEIHSGTVSLLGKLEINPTTSMKSYDVNYELNFSVDNIQSGNIFSTTTELRNYLDKNYNLIETSLGKSVLNYTIEENISHAFYYDYWIQTELSDSFLLDISDTNKYSNDQINKVKQELKDYQERMAKDIISRMPSKKLVGGFYNSHYKYEYIKVDLQVRRFASWENYNDQGVLNGFRWSPLLKDSWF